MSPATSSAVAWVAAMWSATTATATFSLPSAYITGERGTPPAVTGTLATAKRRKPASTPARTLCRHRHARCDRGRRYASINAGVGALKTFYVLAANGVAPNFWGNLQEGGTAPTGANTLFGFGPAQNSLATPFYRGRIGATQANTAQLAASYLDSASGPAPGTGTTIATASDSFVSPAAYSGAFANQRGPLTGMCARPTTARLASCACGCGHRRMLTGRARAS